MTKSISQIFGGEAKVKIIRLFVFNPDSVYEAKTIAGRTQERPILVRKELNNLLKAGLIKRRLKGFVLDRAYEYLAPLREFLVDVSPVNEKQIIKKISKAGVIRLVIISGVFIHNPESRVDILVVGDHLKKSILVSAISSIEAQLGKEIRYSAFETADFKYRLGLYDKLIRDILDFEHVKIINKLGLT